MRIIVGIGRRVKYRVASLKRWLTKRKYQKSILLTDAVTIFGRSFEENSGHFIVRFLQDEARLSTELSERTAIAKFHDEFRPATTGEALGLTLEHDLPLFIYPWGAFGSGAVKSNKSAKLSRFCGPSEETFIKEEEARIRELAITLANEGYVPEKYPHSYIQGVWLTKTNGDKRFVVLQGNHRMAILSFLGHKRISVRTDLFKVRTIRESDSKNWPLVKSGLIDADEALQIFNRFFERRSAG